MAHFGLQPLWFFAAGTIALQLAGSALVVLGGRFAWIGAGALALFTLATIPLAHAFWNLPPQAAFAERLIAEEHISVVGGLLLAALLAHRYGPQWRSHAATR
jgi:transmembrane protein